MDLKKFPNPPADSGRGHSTGSAPSEAKRAEGLKAGEMSILMPLFVMATLGYVGLMVYDSVAGSAFEIPAGVMAVYIAFATEKGSSLDTGQF